jgi:hypothetical protein
MGHTAIIMDVIYYNYSHVPNLDCLIITYSRTFEQMQFDEKGGLRRSEEE